jgi:CRP-like cAMP-binding protein
MSRYESGFDRRTKPTVVANQIHEGVSQIGQGASSLDVTSGSEGLTNQILASLPAPELKRLLPFLDPVTLQRSEEVARSNEYGDCVYFPESVVISHLYLLREGGATAAAVIGNDGVVGLSALMESGPPTHSTRVIIGGEGLRVRADVIKQEFARGETLQRLVLAYMSKRLAQVSQRAVCNARHRLAERLCTWLLMIDDRTDDKALPLTHADIANHLGARRAVISGCCHGLRTRGLITYKRGHIVIRNRKMLEAAACECYQVLKP